MQSSTPNTKRFIAPSNLGLSANPQHDREVASVLIDWKDAINGKFV